MTVIVPRLLVMSLFLLGIVAITTINIIQAKKYQENQKLKKLFFTKPVWSLIIGIVFFALVAYFFIHPIISELLIK